MIPYCPPRNRQDRRDGDHQNRGNNLDVDGHETCDEDDGAREMLHHHRALGHQRVEIVRVNVDIPLQILKEGGIYPVVWVCFVSPVSQGEREGQGRGEGAVQSCFTQRSFFHATRRRGWCELEVCRFFRGSEVDIRRVVALPFPATAAGAAEAVGKGCGRDACDDGSDEVRGGCCGGATGVGMNSSGIVDRRLRPKDLYRKRSCCP